MRIEVSPGGTSRTPTRRGEGRGGRREQRGWRGDERGEREEREEPDDRARWSVRSDVMVIVSCLFPICFFQESGGVLGNATKRTSIYYGQNIPHTPECETFLTLVIFWWQFCEKNPSYFLLKHSIILSCSPCNTRSHQKYILLFWYLFWGD